jgi:hypothetical protein
MADSNSAVQIYMKRRLGSIGSINSPLKNLGYFTRSVVAAAFLWLKDDL